MKKELEEHDVLASRIGDDPNDNDNTLGNDTTDVVTPSKLASAADNCLVNDVLSGNPNASGSRRRHHRRHRRGNEATSGGTGNESGSNANEEDRRRRRATRRAERLRRLNSSPPSTLSNILGKNSLIQHTSLLPFNAASENF